MELVREVYKKVIQNSNYVEQAEKNLVTEIEKLTLHQKEEMPWEKYEEYRDLLFAVSGIAQEEGFVAGARYGINLMIEHYRNN